MKKTPTAAIQEELKLIAEKRLKAEKITPKDSMVEVYQKPCTRTVAGLPEANGFGQGTLMIMKNETVIVCKDGDDSFYPEPGLRLRVVLAGPRYPNLLAGSRLVLGKEYIRICTKKRLEDERFLAKIINTWTRKSGRAEALLDFD